MINRKAEKLTCILAVFCFAAISSCAQTFENIADFTGPGANPTAALVQGTDGNLYGTTPNDSTEGTGYGTIFKITPQGKLVTLYNFCSQPNCTDGKFPNSPLVEASNGNFYGTTMYGGAADAGSIFEATPAGKLTTVYSFCTTALCDDGTLPEGLVRGLDGNFYGTAFYGGLYLSGSIFEITPAGKFTTLYSFCSSGSVPCPDGSFPDSAPTLGTDGAIYGTTLDGGTSINCPNLGGCGTAYKLKAGGQLQILHNFCLETNCADGLYPFAALVQASGGNFYGVTSQGGANCIPTLACGTVFQITEAGNFTTTYSFCSRKNCVDGADPISAMVQGSDGNLYGTAYAGGEYCSNNGGCGTAFAITPEGALTVLHSFCSQEDCIDGSNPLASLVQDTNGIFYGSTVEGGKSYQCPSSGGGCGIVFGLSLGLGSFIEASPDFSKVGQVISLLGSNLAGATSVTFDDTPAKFEVVSSTDIEAEIPRSATTGAIQVTTPGGTLSSNVAFQVVP